MAAASILSMSIVLTPCALTWPTAAGGSCASSRTARIAARSEEPVSPARRADGSHREAVASSRARIRAPRRAACSRDSRTKTTVVGAVREQRVAAGDQRRGMEAAAGAAGQHDVGPAALDHAGGLGDGQQARDVAQHDRVVGTAGIVGDGDVRGGHVGKVLEQPEGVQLLVDRLRPEREVEPAVAGGSPVGSLEILEARVDHVVAEDDAETVGIDPAGGKRRVEHREIGRREAELDFAAHHLQALPRPHEQLRIEVGDLAAEPHAQGAGVEGIDQPDAAGARGQGFPEGVAANADRTHHSDARDDDLPCTAHEWHPKRSTHRPKVGRRSRGSGEATISPHAAATGENRSFSPERCR
jgi:hypothetical protein